MVLLLAVLALSAVVCNSLRVRSLFMSSQHTILKVPAATGPVRLDSFMPETLSSKYTRSYIANLCDAGCVLVNGKVRNKSHKVKEGDQISLNIPPETATDVTPENIHLDILYEDPHMIVINKPAGMVVHPAPGSPNGTFVNAFLHHLGKSAAERLCAESGALTPTDTELDIDVTDNERILRPGIVHRLDKGTSGALLAGKTAHAVSRLSGMFADRLVRKVYVTVCVGNPGDVTIRKRIGRSKTHRQQMVTSVGANGKEAVTHIRTLAFDGRISVCLVSIETGRYVTISLTSAVTAA